jgi:hypothetical protein
MHLLVFGYRRIAFSIFLHGGHHRVHPVLDLAAMKTIVSAINERIDTLTAYRKSLIHECVTGQRRVTEADVRRAGG